MATLWLHDFTAANGTLWTTETVGFDKVLGTTSVVGTVATVNTNKGIAAVTGNESIYRSKYIDALQDYKVSALLDWNNAAGSGRAAGVGVRVSANGRDGYFAILDSNVGSPRIKIVRRRNGVFTALGGGWIGTTEGAGELNAGVTLHLRVQNKADGVHLKVWIGTNVYFDVVDLFADGFSIDSGGTGALYMDASTETNDITFDNFTAEDFEDEATSGTDWQEGIGLSINGVKYSKAEWLAKNLDPVVARVSYGVVPSGQINDLNDAGSPFLHVGDWVQILYNNVVIAEGKLVSMGQEFAPAEMISYQLVSPRQLGEHAPVQDPDTLANYASFNLDATSEFYDADRANKTIGDVFKWLYDNHTEGEDGLRAKGSAPASGACYVEAELTALDAKIPNLSISGNVLQAEETLLTFMPEFAIRIDPATRIRHLDRRSTAPISTFNTTDGHVLPSITRDLSKNYTAVIIYGTAPDNEDQTLLWDPNDPASSMFPFWDRSLEDKWSPDKAKPFKNEGTVIGFGIEPPGDPDNPNFAYIIFDTTVLKMDDHEWGGTMLVFLTGGEQGMMYTVRDNKANGKVWLKAFAWQAGGPGIGDLAALTGVDDPAYKRNGHDAAFKEFDLGGKVIASGPCANAIVTQRTGTKTIEVPVKVRKFDITADDGTTRSGLRLDLPAISLINKLGTLCGSDGGGGAVPADKVQITVPIVQDDSKVPRLRVPEEGFRGTAYSFDSGRWNGGGTARAGTDAGWTRPLLLNFPDFQSVALQGTEYTKAADSMLAVYGAIAAQGTFVHQELVASWAGLNKRLRFIDGATGRTTGYESSNDLWVLQVEFDLRNEATIIGIGTLSALGVDIEAQRKRYAAQTRLDQIRRMRQLAQQLRDCLANAFKGAGAASYGGDNPIPGCNVTSDRGGTSITKRVSEFWDIWIEFIEVLDDLLWIQKGIDLFDAEGNLNDIDDLLDQAAEHGFGGVEGAVQNAIMGSLAYQKGWSFSGFGWEGGQCFPTFTDGTHEFRFNPTTGGIEMFNGTSWVPYSPVVGGLEGAMLSNLGKTIDNATGSVVAPGTVLGGSGGTYYGPSGPVQVPSGSRAPGSVTSKVIADNASALGLNLQANGQYNDALGQPWIPMEDGTWINPTTGAVGVPAWGGALGAALGNLGKTLDAVTGGELAPGSLVPAGGAYHFRPGGAGPELLGGGATVPGNSHTEAKSHEKATSGHTTTPGSHNIQVPANQGASVYAPVAGGGYQKISGTGLAGPSVSGYVGSLAAKCGSTFDGKAMPGSGPGALIPPGTVVGADGAYYYPPTERLDDPDVHQLVAGDTVPASSVTLRNAFARIGASGFEVVTALDKGGVVFKGPGFEGAIPLYYWRVDPQDPQLRLREVTNTPGTGLNGGDWSWGAVYLARSILYDLPLDTADFLMDTGFLGVPTAAFAARGAQAGWTLLPGAPSGVTIQIDLPRNDIKVLAFRVEVTIEPEVPGVGAFVIGLDQGVSVEGGLIAPLLPAVPPTQVVPDNGIHHVGWTLASLLQQRYVGLSINRPTPGVGADTSPFGAIVRGARVMGYYIE